MFLDVSEQFLYKYKAQAECNVGEFTQQYFEISPGQLSVLRQPVDALSSADMLSRI